MCIGPKRLRSNRDTHLTIATGRPGAAHVAQMAGGSSLLTTGRGAETLTGCTLGAEVARGGTLLGRGVAWEVVMKQAVVLCDPVVGLGMDLI